MNHLERATEVVLEPLGAALEHKPSQFAFVEVQGKGWSEPHPFTISSAPGEDRLRFTMKVLGDWTRKVREELQPGGEVIVRGPYGRFDTSKGGKKQIWLAGGIGLTPFLSAIRAMQPGDDRQIHLVYAAREASDAIFLDELKDRAATLGNVTLVPLFSDEGNFARVDIMKVKLPDPLNSYDYYLCGPPPDGRHPETRPQEGRRRQDPDPHRSLRVPVGPKKRRREMKKLLHFFHEIGTIMYVGGILSHIVIGAIFAHVSPETAVTIYTYKLQSAYILILPGLGLKVVTDLILYFAYGERAWWMRVKLAATAFLTVNAFVFLVPMMPEFARLGRGVGSGRRAEPGVSRPGRQRAACGHVQRHSAAHGNGHGLVPAGVHPRGKGASPGLTGSSVEERAIDQATRVAADGPARVAIAIPAA